MKLGKVILSVITAVSIVGTTVASAFTDINETHWAYEKVKLMEGKGVISGFEDGTFRPDTSVTREQFASILVKTLNLAENTQSVAFEDIEKDRWSKIAINKASPYLTGYEIDGKYYFRPSEPAVREDMAVAVVKARGLENKDPDYTVLNKFSDKDKISEGVKKYVALAVENGIMNGNTDGTFNPLGGLTRAEITALMYNVMEKVAINDVIELEEEKHIHKEAERIEDNENGTHKVEIYCKACKEVLSSKTEKHKYEQGKCECGKHELAIDVAIDDEYEVGEKIYFYTYGAEKVEYSLVEDTGKTYLSNEKDNLDEKEKISIEITEDMEGRNFVLNVKAYSGISSVKEVKGFTVDISEDDTESELPEFEINEEDFTINLGKDYEKYRVSYCIGNTPSNWYTPSTNSIASIPINQDGKILLAEMRTSFGYNIFIKLKGESAYKKIEIPVGYPKGYKGCEHSWRNLVDTIEVSSDLKTVEHEKQCVICGLKKKCSGQLWYYNNKTGETHDVYCLNDWCGRVINKEVHNFKDGICKECKAKDINVQSLPDFILNEEESILDLGEEWEKYEVAYSGNSEPGVWYRPKEGAYWTLPIKGTKIYLNDIEAGAIRNMFVRFKDNTEVPYKTINTPRYEIDIIADNSEITNLERDYLPGAEIKIEVVPNEGYIYGGVRDTKGIFFNNGLEVEEDGEKVLIRFKMPQKDVKVELDIEKLEEPYDIYGIDGEEKIRDIVDLGIMNCYEDGDFKPEHSFTRAEMAVSICKLLGISNSNIKGNQNVKSEYDDVKAGEWYTGYVNVLHGKGKLEHFASQPNFRPNEKVSLDEVYTIVINALNRTDDVEDSFSRYAKSIGLNDDVDGNTANRGNVAIILSNALDTPILEVKSTDFETGKVTLEEGDTLREIYF